MSKREEKIKRMNEARLKQLDEAFKYPFCRRCRKPLDKKWVKELRKKGNMPLCPECLPKIMKLYEKTSMMWAEMQKRGFRNK